MAERRMLHKKASVSRDLAELRTKHGADAALFYVLMIPHFDRWGCVPDDALKLRAMVVPMWDATTADVKAWVAWMVKRGMLEKVTGPAGDRGLRSPDFHDHQRGTEFQKESPSPYEPAHITKTWVREGRKPKVADLQGGRRPVGDQSPTRSVRKEGKGSNPSPSFPPSPSTPDGPAASPEPSPVAQTQPPQVEVNGNSRRDRPRLVDENAGEPVKPARERLLEAVKNPSTRAALGGGAP